MEIYKINHLSLNQLNTQLCLSYNNGLIIYDLNEIKSLSSSNTDKFTLVTIYNITT
jgi:hypothetical protein